MKETTAKDEREFKKANEMFTFENKRQHCPISTLPMVNTHSSIRKQMNVPSHFYLIVSQKKYALDSDVALASGESVTWMLFIDGMIRCIAQVILQH